MTPSSAKTTAPTGSASPTSITKSSAFRSHFVRVYPGCQVNWLSHRCARTCRTGITCTSVKQPFVAAQMYYIQGDTMDTIARHLCTSRSTVSRLLKEARESGLVQITLAEPTGPRSPLTQTLQRIFSVRTHVVPVREGSSDVHRLDRVARVAGDCGAGHRNSPGRGDHGTARRRRAAPGAPRRDRRRSSSSMAGPTPSRPASPMWARSSRRPPTRSMLRWCTSRSRRSSTIPRRSRSCGASAACAACSGAATDRPVHLRRRRPRGAGAQPRLLGRVPGRARHGSAAPQATSTRCFLREDGSYADVSLNSRATGAHAVAADPRGASASPQGTAKVSPLLGALRARVATDLVIDDATARAVLDRL